MDPTLEFWIETGANLLIGNTLEKLRVEYINQQEIEKFVADYLSRQYNNEHAYAGRSYEVDFEGLKLFLESKGVDFAYQVVTSLDPEVQTRSCTTLKEQAKQHAHAISSESKHVVDHLIDTILGIISDLLISKLSQSELAMHGKNNELSKEEHEETRSLIRSLVQSKDGNSQDSNADVTRRIPPIDKGYFINRWFCSIRNVL